MIMKKLRPLIAYGITLNHQFGFRQKYSTIGQTQQIADVIQNSSTEKLICSTIFLDMAQTLTRGLIQKLNIHGTFDIVYTGYNIYHKTRG